MQNEMERLHRQVEGLKAEVIRLQQGESDRVQAQELLTESERRLSTLMANLPGMAYRCLNDEFWTMKFVSEGCFDLTGFPPDHLLENHRTNYAELIHPDDRQMVWDKIQSSLKRRSQFNLTYRIHTASGEEKWLLEKGQGVFSDTEDLVAIEGFITDITDRRRAEEALRQIKEFNEDIVQSMSESIVLTDTQGIVIFVNLALEAELGYGRGELIGQSWLVFVSPDHLSIAQAGDKNRATGKRDCYELKLCRKDGSPLWVIVGASPRFDSATGKFIGTMGVFTDITERKRAEKNLEEWRALTDYIIRHDPNAIAVVDENMRYIFVSERFVRDYNVQESNLIGKLHYEVFPEIPERWKQVHRRVLAGVVECAEEDRFERLDGSVDYNRWECRPWYRLDGSVGGIIMYTEVITERKRAEEAVREGEERYRQIVEASTDAILVRAGDLISYANPAALHLFRANHPGDLIGKRYLDLIHPDDRALSAERVKKNIHENWIASPREHRILALDGQVVHVESTGVPVKYRGETQVFGVFRDITERKQTEENLKETEIKYRELAESLPQVIFEVDLNGNLIYLNLTGHELFGFTPEDFAKGFNVLEAFIPEDRERIARDILLNAQGQKLGRQEYTAVKKSGAKFPVGVHANRVMREQAATGVRGLLIDLTPIKLAEEEKKKLEIQLQQAQKMEAIGALAGGIAHDFNNILSAIIGYTELAMLNEGAEHCSAELNEALIAANRAKELVKQILAFSRQTDEERMPVRVGLVAKEAIKFLRATIPTTIEINTRIDEKSGAVVANSVELHQIIMNLCTNAVHAIGEHAGLLEVEVQNTEIDLVQKNDIIDLEIGSYVKLSVRDTGYGMGTDIINRIFDPYFTTKEKGVGTGLGLAVVHGIVKKCGGAIKVESELGKGTTFHIYLPKVDMTAPINTEAPKNIVGGSERILFVDDEKMLVDIGQQVLQRLGYDVVSRTSPIEALELFKAKPDHFDLVITDQTMPGMTGDAFAKELMSIRPNISVIICTGYSQAIDHERAKQRGVKAFVMKPILINEIAVAVRKVLD